MTRIDLHPEDLLDRAMRGSATLADLTQLARHLSDCAVCRVERSLLLQAAFDAAPLRNEKQLLARLQRDVGARLASPMARRARRKSALMAAVLVAVCVAGAAAAATLAVGRRVPGADALRGRAGVAAPVASAARLLVPRLAAPRAEDALPSEPLASEPRPGEGGRDAGRRATPAGAVSSGASELFSRANQARRDGKVTEAVRLYRALQDRYAGSREELVSRVSLGRLLLDRLGDSRGALVQFNSYLASPAGGALREEAMVGRALALGRLGRAAEERAAWQALLDASPKSTHRKRAQARLGELAAAGDPPFVDRAGVAKSVGGGAR
jgi:hypothetical protein